MSGKSTRFQLDLYKDRVQTTGHDIFISDYYSGKSAIHAAEISPPIRFDNKKLRYIVSQDPYVVIIDAVRLLEQHFLENYPPASVLAKEGNSVKSRPISLDVLIHDSFFDNTARIMIKSDSKVWKRTRYLFNQLEGNTGATINFKSSQRKLIYVPKRVSARPGYGQETQQLSPEKQFLHNITKKSDYQPEDIVCVAFGTMKVPSEKNKKYISREDIFPDGRAYSFVYTYLTQRGQEENYEKLNKEVYRLIKDSCFSMVEFKPIVEGLDTENRDSIDRLRKDHSILEFVDLTPISEMKGVQKSVIAIYRTSMMGQRNLRR